MGIAREPDKIVYSRLIWNDPEMLLRVVEERFSATLGIDPNEGWSRYFCPQVKGTATKNYFANRVLKRPRDLLYFVKAAITTAVNRRHGIVEERDILDAEKQYSQFAVDSILVENGLTISELEQIIYEFVGSSSIITESEISTILTKGNIPEEQAAYLVNHLCALSFLGVEVNPNEFRFSDEGSEHHKNLVLAQKLGTKQNRQLRFKINPAFWAFLEVQE